MPSGIPESHVTISRNRDASRIHILFRFIGGKGTSVKSEKEQCDFETCHDREAYPMVRKGLEFQTQEPLAILARGRSRSNLTRQVEVFETSRQMERDLW